MKEIAGFPGHIEPHAEHARYYVERVERIMAGEEVLLQRNFDAGTGRVFDLYTAGEQVGFIVQDYEDMRSEAYKTPADIESSPELVTAEPVPLIDAVHALQKATQNKRI